MTISGNLRELLRSVAMGHTDSAQSLNDRLSDGDRAQLGIYGTAVMAICLGHRFEEDSSPEAIRKFAHGMAANYANAQPPLKPFVIEGVIRAFAGEEHILDEISAEDQLDSHFPIIREIVAGSGELQARIDDVLTDAETLVREWEAEEG